MLIKIILHGNSILGTSSCDTLAVLYLNNTDHPVAIYFSFMYFRQAKHSAVEKGEAKMGIGVLEGL